MNPNRMRRRVLVSTACALALPAAAVKASTSGRVAWVVGNSQYPGALLRNPGADAMAVAQALKELGFGVTLQRELAWAPLLEAARAFADSSTQATLRLVYFAGHGVQLQGRNLLLPLDVDPGHETELLARSLDSAELLARLARQAQATTMMILDACRQHPQAGATVTADGRRLRSRGAAAGLARMAVPAGSLVAYSTAPGQVADDAQGGAHSLYTRHLLAHLPTPSLPVEALFKRVRLGVLRDSQSRQQPWEESSLTAEVCLSGPCRV